MNRLFRVASWLGMTALILTMLTLPSISQPLSNAVVSHNDAWPPFVRIIPQAHSDDVLVSASGIAQLYTQLYADFGSTSHTWSHTDLKFDEHIEAYQGIAAEALSEICSEPSGCLRVYHNAFSAQSFTQAITIPYQFVRVKPDDAPDLALHSAQIRFGAPPFGDEIEHTVILQIPPALPNPLPANWTALSQEYYLVESDGMDGDLRASLAIRYDPDAIVWFGADETDLTILAWDAANGEWHPLESYVNRRAHHVSASIQNLTTYILAVPQEHHVWLPMFSTH